MRKSDDSFGIMSLSNESIPEGNLPSSTNGDGMAENEKSTSFDVVLIEANTLLREGLKRILVAAGYTIRASAPSLDEALRLTGDADFPCLTIMGSCDVQHEPSEAIAALKARTQVSRVVVLVEAYETKQILSALKAGADAYLMKTISHEVLLKSLELVQLGEVVFPSGILDLLRNKILGEEDGSGFKLQLAGNAGDSQVSKALSLRETVILRCLMQGDSNKLIARKFDIAEATVKVHVKAILRKIHAKNRTQAAMWAASHLQAERPELLS